MQPVRTSLKRKGALAWHLAEDITQPGSMLESFTVATWSEYQRLPERTTVADDMVTTDLVRAAGTDMPELVAHRVLDVRESRA